MGLDRIALDFVAKGIDRHLQAFFRHDLGFATQENFQNAPFFCGQADRRPCAGHAVVVKPDAQIADYCCLGHLVRAAAADCVDARLHFVQIKGFDDIIIRPAVQAVNPVGNFVARG